MEYGVVVIHIASNALPAPNVEHAGVEHKLVTVSLEQLSII